MIPATPRFFNAAAVTYDFDPNPPMPARWLAFLDQLFPNDPDSILLLREWIGHLLTPDTSYQKVLMMIGPKRSGKGTIIRVIQKLIGEANVAFPTLSALSTQFGIETLIGRSAAIITDARLSGKTDAAAVVERLLSISGEDGQSIPRKYATDLTTTLPTRFMLVSNETPKLVDSSGALAGRLLLLSLTESFAGREDRQLTTALVAELPGILLWACEGWRSLRQRGRFVQPPSGAAILAEFTESSSPIGQFLSEVCTIDPTASVLRKDLFSAWETWCQSNGRHSGDSATFGRNLRAALPTVGSGQIRVPGGLERTYKGLCLT